ncbi:hypothetical protein B0H12DRAFT_1069818 [Mycena haematopus]|nr:hypothetical protein B0H12DRAFT_1069818 [Mycena haematopus]
MTKPKRTTAASEGAHSSIHSCRGRSTEKGGKPLNPKILATAARHDGEWSEKRGGPGEETNVPREVAKPPRCRRRVWKDATRVRRRKPNRTRASSWQKQGRGSQTCARKGRCSNIPNVQCFWRTGGRPQALSYILQAALNEEEGEDAAFGPRLRLSDFLFWIFAFLKEFLYTFFIISMQRIKQPNPATKAFLHATPSNLDVKLQWAYRTTAFGCLESEQWSSGIFLLAHAGSCYFRRAHPCRPKACGYEMGRGLASASPFVPSTASAGWELDFAQSCWSHPGRVKGSFSSDGAAAHAAIFILEGRSSVNRARDLDPPKVDKPLGLWRMRKSFVPLSRAVLCKHDSGNSTAPKEGRAREATVSTERAARMPRSLITAYTPQSGMELFCPPSPSSRAGELGHAGAAAKALLSASTEAPQKLPIAERTMQRLEPPISQLTGCVLLCSFAPCSQFFGSNRNTKSCVLIKPYNQVFLGNSRANWRQRLGDPAEFSSQNISRPNESWCAAFEALPCELQHALSHQLVPSICPFYPPVSSLRGSEWDHLVRDLWRTTRLQEEERSAARHIRGEVTFRKRATSGAGRHQAAAARAALREPLTTRRANGCVQAATAHAAPSGIQYGKPFAAERLRVPLARSVLSRSLARGELDTVDLVHARWAVVLSMVFSARSFVFLRQRSGSCAVAAARSLHGAPAKDAVIQYTGRWRSAGMTALLIRNGSATVSRRAHTGGMELGPLPPSYDLLVQGEHGRVLARVRWSTEGLPVYGSRNNARRAGEEYCPHQTQRHATLGSRACAANPILGPPVLAYIAEELRGEKLAPQGRAMQIALRLGIFLRGRGSWSRSQRDEAAFGADEDGIVAEEIAQVFLERPTCGVVRVRPASQAAWVLLKAVEGAQASQAAMKALRGHRRRQWSPRHLREIFDDVPRHNSTWPTALALVERTGGSTQLCEALAVGSIVMRHVAHRSSKGFTVLKEDLRKAGSRLGARDAGKGEASRRLRRVSRCNPTGSGSMSPLPGLHIQEWGAVIRMLSHPGGR